MPKSSKIKSVAKRQIKKQVRRSARRTMRYIAAGIIVLAGAVAAYAVSHSFSSAVNELSDVKDKEDNSDGEHEAAEEDAVSDFDSAADAAIVFEKNSNMERVCFSQKVDGDTAYFTLESGEEIKVRFLAVDTPETVKTGTEVQEWGPESSEYTANRLQSADEIYLEWDDNSDMKDKYDRYLAWVWVDGSLLEEELISRGLAEVKYIYGDYKYVDQLYSVQSQAQDQCLGIWSAQSLNGMTIFDVM